MIDIEVFRICDGTNTSWEFRAKSSAGQDWIEEDLELQNTGQNTKKLVVNDWEDARSTVRRMLDTGLDVKAGMIGGLP